MITLCRSAEREHHQLGGYDVWFTCHAEGQRDPPVDGGGPTATFAEIRVPPGGQLAADPQKKAEVFTYVYRGALVQADSTGSSGVLRAGEFQRRTVGRTVRYKEANASQTDWAHVFRISLSPAARRPTCAHDEKRFAAAQRRNVLRVVAAADGRNGSLLIRQDAFIYSSILDDGRHLVHELGGERTACLHVIGGRSSIQDISLGQGDGVSVSLEPSVSFTALEQGTEILLVDLGPKLGAFSGGQILDGHRLHQTDETSLHGE